MKGYPFRMLATLIALTLLSSCVHFGKQSKPQHKNERQDVKEFLDEMHERNLSSRMNDSDNRQLISLTGIYTPPRPVHLSPLRQID